MLTQARLRELFVYEPDTGLLRRVVGGRKPYPWRGAGADRRYLVSTVDGVTLYLHQAVFLYHFGYVPARIDHRDRDTKNCRIGNLRECTATQNQHNSKRKKNNRSGYKGVAFDVGYRKPWRARIVVNKRVIELGHFDTPEEAATAYAEGAKRYAGEFARTE